MSAERVMVRCFITAIAVIVGIIAAPVFALFKGLIGVQLAYQIAREAIRQVWAGEGTAGFDRFTKG